MNALDLLGEPVLRRDAFFSSSDCRRRLSRDWGPGPRALVIGCNPSNACRDREDRTSRWWNAWFSFFGFGGYDAVNLYSFVSSSPADCRQRAEMAIGGPNWHDRDELFANLAALTDLAKRADQVFVCWGAIAWDQDWVEHVVEEVQSGVAPYLHLWCWGTTASGAPKHPLARGKHRIEPEQCPILWRAS